MWEGTVEAIRKKRNGRGHRNERFLELVVANKHSLLSFKESVLCGRQYQARMRQLPCRITFHKKLMGGHKRFEQLQTRRFLKRNRRMIVFLPLATICAPITPQVSLEVGGGGVAQFKRDTVPFCSPVHLGLVRQRIKSVSFFRTNKWRGSARGKKGRFVWHGRF